MRAAFFSDIDGTLLGADREVSAVTVSAIQRVITAGFPFVLCSSRPPASMRLLQEPWAGSSDLAVPFPLIAYNGGLVLLDDGTVAADVRLTASDALAIFDACSRLGVHGSFYSGDDWFAWADDRWAARETANTKVTPRAEDAAWYRSSGTLDASPPHKVMCMGEVSAVDEIEALVASLPDAVGYRSKPTYLEIAAAGCSKGTGVATVAAHLGVPLADCVFFGDNHNDLPAFEVVGTPVAVANARPEVLAATAHHTSTHHSHGVATYLTEWLAASAA
ncbi:HAD-IIB family hydrolase [Herbiconiux sp. KACC 21604]|uniref:HAD-IIB family hydrolase n=1 Tax=Herbiconiux sp. KACC 21604 TaxID=3092664 RepID=UPI00388FBED5|nr:HAD-IIB family hydrolase [Herbiconiux sp. KACC 21604]